MNEKLKQMIEAEAKEKYPSTFYDGTLTLDDKNYDIKRNAFLAGAEFMDSISESKQMKWTDDNKPLVVEKFADNGAHDHWDLIDITTGNVLWTNDESAEQGKQPGGCDEFAKGVRKILGRMEASLNGSLDGLELDNTADVIEKHFVIEVVKELIGFVNEMKSQSPHPKK